MIFTEFDPKKFTSWINKKRLEFQGEDVRLKSTDFAKFLGEKQQTVSYWLLGNLNRRPSDESCNRLIERYGFEAYDPLGIIPPSADDVFANLSDKDAAAFLGALEEIRESGLAKENAITSPDDIRRITEIFSRHGLTVKKMEK